MTAPALDVRGIGHAFGGLTVLTNVSFEVPAGRIVGLIGPNGSGKSTLFNILNGFLVPQSGSVMMAGNDTRAMSVEARSRVGMVRTFQTPRVFEHLSVQDNIMVGACKLTRSGALSNMLSLPRARRDLALMREVAEAVIERFGLQRLREVPAAKLTSGQRRMLELARAYAGKPQLLLLDEPSSGLNTAEVEALGKWLQTFNDEGMTLLLVSHDMQLMNIASVVNVLYFGEIIASGPMAEMQRNPRVREVYLGM
ncbi:MAG: ABC transporter ATP-binding protein [Betaproteobacteria bacterium]|nr:ABC transporter ATP-binding protein [Betaproteobacteria bacterium]